MQQIVLDGKYRLDERLGEGAIGVVYRALHLGLKKSFAVKLLKTASPDPFSLARFRREAEALGQLRHPHVVDVTDFGIDAAAGGVPYLVMELLEGTTLADFCRQHGPLPLDRALSLLKAIAEAVDAAHAQGVLHRDLKPGNILLCPTAEGEPRVKVLDFGLAEISRGSLIRSGEDLRSDGEGASAACLTATGALLGTPLYVAPELIRQRAASRASDLYSFGVIAYEILAGHPPFQGSTAEVLAGHLVVEPPAPTRLRGPLPKAVWEILQECLRKDLALRPTSASDVVRRARQAMEQAAPKPWWVTRIPRRAGLSVGLILIVLLAGLVLPWSVLLWTEQWLQDLVARSTPAQAPEPRSSLHAPRPGGEAHGDGREPLLRPAVINLPAGEPEAAGPTPPEFGQAANGQAPGDKTDSHEKPAAAAGSSGVAALLADPLRAAAGFSPPVLLPVRTSSVPAVPKPSAELVALMDFLDFDRELGRTRDSVRPVALVYALAGEAEVTFPTEKGRPLRLFERLPEDTWVEVGPGSRLALAFAIGHRYELGGGSRAILGPTGLSWHIGPVRPLPTVRPLPCLVPDPFQEECLRGMAANVGLYPRCGTRTLAGATILRFEPIEGRRIYSVEVHEREGNMVYAAPPRGTSAVIVPSKYLQPGVHYRWMVRTLEAPFEGREMDFVTMPEELAEAREALRRAVETEKGVDSLALLAEVDRCLGLLPEARDEFREVVRAAPSAGALYQLGILESALGDLAGAEERLQQALAIQEALTPGNLDVVEILRQLGIVAWKRGGFQAAEPFHRRALEIQEKLAQGSLQHPP